jgi:hypothetical protein
MNEEGLIIIKNQWTERLDDQIESFDNRPTLNAMRTDQNHIVVDKIGTDPSQRNSNMKSTWVHGFRGSSIAGA